jgi:hypothetical protein
MYKDSSRRSREAILVGITQKVKFFLIGPHEKERGKKSGDVVKELWMAGDKFFKRRKG